MSATEEPLTEPKIYGFRSLIQNSSDLGTQVVKGVRLAYQFHARVQSAMMNNRISRIAGSQQHLECGADPNIFIRQLASIDAARHDNISEQEVD